MVRQVTVILLFFSQSLGYAQEFGGGARQAVQPRHHEDISLAKLFDELLGDRLKRGGLFCAPVGTTGTPFGDHVVTFKGAVHYCASNLEHQVRTARSPAHLLLGVDGGLNPRKSGADVVTR